MKRGGVDPLVSETRNFPNPSSCFSASCRNASRKKRNAHVRVVEVSRARRGIDNQILISIYSQKGRFWPRPSSLVTRQGVTALLASPQANISWKTWQLGAGKYISSQEKKSSWGFSARLYDTVLFKPSLVVFFFFFFFSSAELCNSGNKLVEMHEWCFSFFLFLFFCLKVMNVFLFLLSVLCAKNLAKKDFFRKYTSSLFSLTFIFSFLYYIIFGID